MGVPPQGRADPLQGRRGSIRVVSPLKSLAGSTTVLPRPARRHPMTGIARGLQAIYDWFIKLKRWVGRKLLFDKGHGA